MRADRFGLFPPDPEYKPGWEIAKNELMSRLRYEIQRANENREKLGKNDRQRAPLNFDINILSEQILDRCDSPSFQDRIGQLERILKQPDQSIIENLIGAEERRLETLEKEKEIAAHGSYVLDIARKRTADIRDLSLSDIGTIQAEALSKLKQITAAYPEENPRIIEQKAIDYAKQNNKLVTDLAEDDYTSIIATKIEMPANQQESA